LNLKIGLESANNGGSSGPVAIPKPTTPGSSSYRGQDQQQPLFYASAGSHDRKVSDEDPFLGVERSLNHAAGPDEDNLGNSHQVFRKDPASFNEENDDWAKARKDDGNIITPYTSGQLRRTSSNAFDLSKEVFEAKIKRWILSNTMDESDRWLDATSLPSLPPDLEVELSEKESKLGTGSVKGENVGFGFGSDIGASNGGHGHVKFVPHHEHRLSLRADTVESNFDELHHHSRQRSDDSRESGGSNTHPYIHHGHNQSNSRSHGPADYDLMQLIPLLSQIYSLPLQDSDRTKGLKRKSRDDLLESFVVRLLYLSCVRADTKVVVVDSLHWCDYWSLRIIYRFMMLAVPHSPTASTLFLGSNTRPDTARNKYNFIGNTLLIAMTRPLDEIEKNPKRQKHFKLLTSALSRAKIIKLRPFTAQEVKTVVELTLGQELLLLHPNALSSNNIRSVLERSNGSPTHAIILAVGMKNALQLRAFTGVEDLPPAADHVTLSRFDHLSKPDQLILKTASAIGTYFNAKEIGYILSAINISAEGNTVNRSLENLQLSNLIQKEDQDASSDSYKFSDNIIRMTIYNVMLATQRELVHTAYAEYLERHFSNDVNYFNDILFHYSHSFNVPKKLHYLARAAQSSKLKNTFNLHLKYFCSLIKIISGISLDELLLKCTQSKIRSSSFFSMIVPTKDLKAQSSTELTGKLHINRWLSHSDFRSRAKPQVHVSDGVDLPEEYSKPQTLCSHIVEVGIAQIM